MDRQQIARRRRHDRLSNLGERTLGHILSFLDPREAARAAVLSSRWRDVFASVHTVSMEEPESPIPDYDSDGGYCTRQVPSSMPVSGLVTAALLARSSRAAPAAAPVPLRVLRVAMQGSCWAVTVDQWIAYALKHAAPELEIELFLRPREPVCTPPDPFRSATSQYEDRPVGGKTPVVTGVAVDEEDDVASSADETDPQPWNQPPAGYTAPGSLFSCAAMRSLRLGSCGISLPTAVSLPSLQTLHLTHIAGAEEQVQRLISACPRLTDLMLQACQTVTALSLLDNKDLRRLALRCCHKLDIVTVDESELYSFDYRHGVTGNSFLTVRGAGGGLLSVTSCKVDICSVCVKEATSSEQVAMLGSFLQLFASAEHLHLCAARVGSCFVDLPAFARLRRLQLNGRAQHEDNDHASAAVATTRILQQAPNLEALTLFFEAGPHEAELHGDNYHYYYADRKEGELLDAHHLQYNQYETLDYEPTAVPACLGSRVKRINLVHYHGGRAQRMLARFLLCNAAVLEKLSCEFAEGPLWIQKELMREMEGWVVNQKASKEFR